MDQQKDSPLNLQGLLEAAAAAKAVQVRQLPGRRLWEAAPEFLRRTALADSEVEAVRQAPLPEQIVLCRQLKQDGNTAFEQNDADAALDHYTRAISVFMWFSRARDRSAESIQFHCTTDSLPPDGPQREEVHGLLAATFNNISSCLFKLNKSVDAGFAASKALEYDPYSVKALYRRAHALYEQHSTESLELAVKDLLQAQSLEPGNTQVRTTLTTFRQELLEQKRKDAAAFGGVFNNGQLYGSSTAAGQANNGHQRDQDKLRVPDADVQGTGIAQEAPLGRDKSQDPHPMEVERTLQQMRRNLDTARSRPPSMRPPVPVRRPGHADGDPSEEVGGFAGLFAHVPWWAWLLIGLHLAYRIYRLWSSPLLPLPGAHTAPSTYPQGPSDTGSGNWGQRTEL